MASRPGTFVSGLRTVLRAVAAAALVPSCPCCREEMGWGVHGVCEDCWRDLIPAGPGSCEICCGPLPPPEERAAAFRCHRCLDLERKGEGPSFDAVVAWGYYDGRLRQIVHAFKYRDRPGLARPLGDRLASAILARGLGPGLRGSIIVPVPPDPARRRRRGYDQALLLACRVRAGLAREGFAPRAIDRSLRRVGTAAPQTGLAREERLLNPRGAYASRGRRSLLRGRRALLVDDVLTTGATAGECASVLRRAGASSVIVAVVARTPAPGISRRSGHGSGGGDGESD